MPGNFNRLRNPSSYATEADIAWLAGFFEGEGTVTRVQDPRSGRWSYSMVFFQVNPEPMVKVHALCGGSASVRIWRRSNPNAKPCMKIVVGGERGIALAHKLAPYLSTKRLRQIAPMLVRPPHRAAYSHWKGHPGKPMGKRWIATYEEAVARG